MTQTQYVNGQDSASMKMNVKKCLTVHFGKQKNLKIDNLMIDMSGSKSIRVHW